MGQRGGACAKNDAVTVTLREFPQALSHFVGAGVKKAKIVSATARNQQLQATCRSFLFGMPQPTANTLARIKQVLSLVNDQSSIHENEVAKPARKERKATVRSALSENHFRKERFEKKQKQGQSQQRHAKVSRCR
jgi:hypothetical protein